MKRFILLISLLFIACDNDIFEVPDDSTNLNSISINNTITQITPMKVDFVLAEVLDTAFPTAFIDTDIEYNTVYYIQNQEDFDEFLNTINLTRDEFNLNEDTSFHFSEFDYLFVYQEGSSSCGSASKVLSFTHEDGTISITLGLEDDEILCTDDLQKYFKIIELITPPIE